LKEYGNAWIMIAFDPVNRVVITFVVGKRNQKEIDLLIKNSKRLIVISLILHRTNWIYTRKPS
jgi:IS1 family transposase